MIYLQDGYFVGAEADCYTLLRGSLDEPENAVIIGRYPMVASAISEFIKHLSRKKVGEDGIMSWRSVRNVFIDLEADVLERLIDITGELSDERDALAYQRQQLDSRKLSWLIETRTALGLSRKDISERVGIDQAYYYKIESGENNPSQKTMMNISNALSFPMERWSENAR